MNAWGGYRIVIAVLEVGCYIGVIGYCAIWNSDYAVLDAIAVVALAAGLVLTMSKCSILAYKFNNRLTYFLGEITIPLYLNHYYYVSNAQEIGSKLGIQNDDMARLVCIVLSILTSVVIYLFVKIFRRIFSKKET